MTSYVGRVKAGTKGPNIHERPEHLKTLASAQATCRQESENQKSATAFRYPLRTSTRAAVSQVFLRSSHCDPLARYLDPGSIGIHLEFITAAARLITGEALVGLVGAHAMRLNCLSLPKKFSMRCRHLYISLSMARGFARRGCWEMMALGAARVEFGGDGVAVARIVGDQRVEGQFLDEWLHAHRVEALSGQQHEAHEIA